MYRYQITRLYDHCPDSANEVVGGYEGCPEKAKDQVGLPTPNLSETRTTFCQISQILSGFANDLRLNNRGSYTV